jgi:hypothetical protein
MRWTAVATQEAAKGFRRLTGNFQRYVSLWKRSKTKTQMTLLLAKSTPHNVNHDNDRFSMFNKKRDIARSAAGTDASSLLQEPALTVSRTRRRQPGRPRPTQPRGSGAAMLIRERGDWLSAKVGDKGADRGAAGHRRGTRAIAGRARGGA